MKEQNQYDWVDFYREFASILLDYKNRRDELIEKVNAIYAMTGISMPTLERDNELVDIDPFTVFGLFNKKLTDENRINVLTAIAKLFDVKTAVPTSFDSLPVLDPRNATFYNFVDQRGAEDIDDLWSLYASAMAYAQSSTAENRNAMSRDFDLVMNKKGSGNSKITMALYWIAPDVFLNLDSRNEWYIYKSGKMSTDFVKRLPKIKSKISAAKYFEITEAMRSYLQSDESPLKDFKELSFEAWVYSEQVNKEKSEKKENKFSNASILQWFAPLIQALRDLGGSATPAEARAKIIENENLTEEEISVTRGKNNVNKFENEVAFARSYLVNAGYIDKSVYGVWTLTEAGMIVDMTRELASDIFKSVFSSGSVKSDKKNAALADEDVQTKRYWIYSPGEGSCMWDEFYDSGIMAIGWGGIGDLTAYDSKDAMKVAMKETFDESLTYRNAAHLTWQFANEMKIGDVVFVKKGMHRLIGRGIVMSDYEFDDSRTDEFKHIRQVDWTHRGDWPHPGQAVMKTLTDITPYTDYVEKLKAIFEEESEEDVEEVEKSYPIYTKDDFLSDVYMSEEEYEKLAGVLRVKKNIVLQGAPGVGKTFAAKRLAFSMMGVKDVERVMMIQFHQSYSYEDFIMGFRPSSDGFELRRGAFYNFCKKAEIDGDKDYFFIIDEINRGNLSKIFGELFMLIENDKRGVSLQLLYSDEKFAVPKNIYIIGMMNTADRSLAMLDYALRRRFAFFEIKPGFGTEGFEKYKQGLENEKFDRLIACVEDLNNAISADETLGEGFCIGHSYFCNLSPDSIDEQILSGIVEYELIPLLKEYWFDEPAKVENWIGRLRSAIQ
ncbi:AAA family ATPase [Aedoeadaptatus urinae]|uniref:AAA family ATPase n=1 Tax=Aedoeadaptatus urinae TaxID=1871017 RepID=UPI00097D385E|nr:AAA family ATPase [Peptoniphilus urinae]